MRYTIPKKHKYDNIGGHLTIVMIVRHGLLAKLVKLWKENRLLEEIDRLPIELSPLKIRKCRSRCCVHMNVPVLEIKPCAA